MIHFINNVLYVYNTLFIKWIIIYSQQPDIDDGKLCVKVKNMLIS